MKINTKKLLFKLAELEAQRRYREIIKDLGRKKEEKILYEK